MAGFTIHSEGTISSLQVQSPLPTLMAYFTVLSKPRAVFTFQHQHLAERVTFTNKVTEKRIQRINFLYGTLMSYMEIFIVSLCLYAYTV